MPVVAAMTPRTSGSQRFSSSPAAPEVRAIGSAFLAWNAAASESPATGNNPMDPNNCFLDIQTGAGGGVAGKRADGSVDLDDPDPLAVVVDEEHAAAAVDHDAVGRVQAGVDGEATIAVEPLLAGARHHRHHQRRQPRQVQREALMQSVGSVALLECSELHPEAARRWGSGGGLRGDIGRRARLA